MTIEYVLQVMTDDNELKQATEVVAETVKSLQAKAAKMVGKFPEVKGYRYRITKQGRVDGQYISKIMKEAVI